MDLDDEELKATQNREKSADKMFKNLGYKKIRDNQDEVRYLLNEKFLGDKFEHTLLISKISKNIFHINNCEGNCMGIDIDLLQAINKKCKELGYLDV